MVNSPFYRLQGRSSKNPFRLPAVLILGATLFATGCHQAIKDPNDPKFIVAEKGPWQYTRAELDGQVATFLQMSQATAVQVGPEKMLRLDAQMLDYVVLNKLVADRAAALQIKDTDKLEAEQLDLIKQRNTPPGQDFNALLKAHGVSLDVLKKSIHEQVLMGEVLKADAFKNDDPSEKEINDFYLQNQQSFVIPEKVRVSRILIHLDPTVSPADKVAKKKAIDKAHDRIVHGEEFFKVATQVSEDRSSAPNGGDLGFFQKGISEPGFDEVAFTTKKGVVSPVFETPLGFEFIKVTDTQPAGVVSLADARAKISAYLSQAKKKQERDDYLKKLLADGGVTYHFFAPQVSPGNGGASAPAGADSAQPSAPPSAPPADQSAAPASSTPPPQ